MSNDDAIIQLLREIRDLQREEIVWRKKVMEEALVLQRSALRWQRLALVMGVGLIVAGVLGILWLFGLLYG